MPAPYKRIGSNPVNLGQQYDPGVLLRLQRMGRELRLTDQILSSDLDTLIITDEGDAPAWTSADGGTMTINAARMPHLHMTWTDKGSDDLVARRRIAVRKAIAVWLGTNAHELFHNLYTPRVDALLMRRVSAAQRSTDPGIHRSWNVLEDQRIERLGLARYAGWRGYLIAALSHHIPVDHPEAWPLVAGRTWLPDEVRAIARSVFVATKTEWVAHRAAELIGAYQSLVDPGEADADEAWAILVEFHGLVGDSLPPRGGCGSKPVKDGEPQEVYDDECQYPTADEADADEDEWDDDESDEADESDEDEVGGGDESDDDDESDEDESDGGGSDEGDDDESDEGDSTDGDCDSDDESEGDDDGDPDEGEGEGDDAADESDDGDESDDHDGKPSDDGPTGDGDPGDGCSAPDGVRRTMDEAMQDAIEDALDESDTAADLDRVVDNLAHGASGPNNLPRTTGEWLDVTEAGRSLARSVTDVLVDIKDDCEAAWLRHTDSGRFSVDRWATDPNWDADNVFDRFDPGAMDASSLELVLVLDISGSMSSQIHTLAEATWAIRTAVDRVEGECTVIGFGDGASLIFGKGQRPDGRMFIPHLEGSTDPVGALREAHRIVEDSGATNRLVIVMTDGSWWNTDVAAKSVRAAAAAGAITCLIGLGHQGHKLKPGFAGAQHVENIRDSAELVPIFKRLTVESMKQAAGGRIG